MVSLAGVFGSKPLYSMGGCVSSVVARFFVIGRPPRLAARPARPADAAPPACPSAAVLKKSDPRPAFRGNFCEAVRRSAPRLLEGFAPALPPGLGLSRRPSVRGFAPPFPKNPPHIEKPARPGPRGRRRLRLCRGACCPIVGRGCPSACPFQKICYPRLNRRKFP